MKWRWTLNTRADFRFMFFTSYDQSQMFYCRFSSCFLIPFCSLFASKMFIWLFSKQVFLLPLFLLPFLLHLLFHPEPSFSRLPASDPLLPHFFFFNSSSSQQQPSSSFCCQLEQISQKQKRRQINRYSRRFSYKMITQKNIALPLILAAGY